MLQKVDRIMDEVLAALVHFNAQHTQEDFTPPPTPVVDEQKDDPEVFVLPDPLPKEREEVKQLLTDLGVEFNTRAAMTTLMRLMDEAVKAYKNRMQQPAPLPATPSDLFPAQTPEETKPTVDSIFNLGAAPAPEPEPVEQEAAAPFDAEKMAEELKAFIDKWGDEPVRQVLAHYKCERFSELDPEVYPVVMEVLNDWAAKQESK